MKPSPIKKIIVFVKQGSERAFDACLKIKKWAMTHDIAVWDTSKYTNPIPLKKLMDIQLGIVFGGDGTFLTFVRQLSKKDCFPIVGVNLGSLGFITELDEAELSELLPKIVEGRFPEEKRMLLNVEVIREGKILSQGLIFNDAIITKDAGTTMLHLDIFVEKEHLSYVRGDGYIVATPTGSTAYALSAGGAILYPSLLGYVLVPICSHSLSTRPAIIPHQKKTHVLLRQFRGSAYLVFDGKIETKLQPNDKINFEVSDVSLRLIRPHQKRWAKILQTKLNMG